MKYERTDFGAYKSRKTPVAYVEDVIINFGKNIELILYEHLFPALRKIMHLMLHPTKPEFFV